MHELFSTGTFNSSSLMLCYWVGFCLLFLLFDIYENFLFFFYVQIKILLMAIKDFNPACGDAAYTMGIVDLLLECVELSYRPGNFSIKSVSFFFCCLFYNSFFYFTL